MISALLRGLKKESHLSGILFFPPPLTQLISFCTEQISLCCFGLTEIPQNHKWCHWRVKKEESIPFMSAFTKTRFLIFSSFFLSFFVIKKINLRAEVDLQSSHLYDWTHGHNPASHHNSRAPSEVSPLLAGTTWWEQDFLHQFLSFFSLYILIYI